MARQTSWPFTVVMPFTRSLELLIARKDLPADLLERSLSQCARVFMEMGLEEAARPLWNRIVGEFPYSPAAELARHRLS